MTDPERFEGPYYHGSQKLFDAFKVFSKAVVSEESYPAPVFVTKDKYWAIIHGSPNGYLYTVDVDLGKTFGTNLYRPSKYWPPAFEDLTKEGQELYTDILENKIFPGAVEEWELNQILKDILNYDWDTIEQPNFLRWLKKHNYDSSPVRGESEEDTFAIFDPSKIKIKKIEKIEYDPEIGRYVTVSEVGKPLPQIKRKLLR